MADIYDQATDHEMRERELALSVVRANADKQPRLTANGLCHNCGEQLSDGIVFCDSFCRDDWQMRVARNK